MVQLYNQGKIKLEEGMAAASTRRIHAGGPGIEAGRARRGSSGVSAGWRWRDSWAVLPEWGSGLASPRASRARPEAI